MTNSLSTPNTNQLIDAVTNFLKSQVSPQVDTHTQFHLKVACNVLKIVSREIDSANDNERLPLLHRTLAALLDAPLDQDLSALYQQLCADIKSGALAMENPDLLPLLRQLTEHQLKIDNPKYSGLNL